MNCDMLLAAEGAAQNDISTWHGLLFTNDFAMYILSICVIPLERTRTYTYTWHKQLKPDEIQYRNYA